MVTTRRANGIVKPSTKAQSTSPPHMAPTSAIPAPTHSPFLPTYTEKLIFLVYPTTLVLGSLFSHLSPTLYPPFNQSTYSTAQQSFQPASAAPSYFAQKRNVFNVYFVKLGWFWCTFAFFVFLFFVGRGRRTPPRKRQQMDLQTLERKDAEETFRRRYQALLRYLLSTGLWFATTQWFFGPPLVDRGFLLTGGMCRFAEEELANADTPLKDEVASALTSVACRAVGGRWIGGYDISGHVFILVLGSGMLWMEMLPYLLPKIKGLGVGRVVRTSTGADARVAHEIGATELYVEDMRVDAEMEPVAWSIKASATTMALAIAVLSWWMLLMTAAFFHTWFEKLTGWLLAMSGLWLIYFLPRGVPAVRSFLGIPGV